MVVRYCCLFLFAIFATSCTDSSIQVFSFLTNPNPILTSGYINLASLSEEAYGTGTVRVSFDNGETWKHCPANSRKCKIAVPNASNSKHPWVTHLSYTVIFQMLDGNGDVRKETVKTIRKALNRDVDGDGYADVLTGENPSEVAFGRTAPDTSAGRVVIFHGTDLKNREKYDPDNPPKWMGYRTIENPETGVSREFGASIASGDYNGDGLADIAVGAPGGTYRDGYQNRARRSRQSGKVYLYLGRSEAAPEAALTLDVPTMKSLGCPHLPADPSSCLYDVEARFGRSVATAGDVDGDGLDDLLVGAFLSAEFGNREFMNVSDQTIPNLWDTLRKIPKGAVYLYLGRDLVEGITQPHLKIGPPAEGSDAVFFGWSLASAGDIDGDGKGDVMIGATYEYAALMKMYDLEINKETQEEEKVNERLEVGSAFFITAKELMSATDGRLELGQQNELPRQELTNEDFPNAGYRARSGPFNYGQSVSGVGDVNGDGLNDLVVGASGISFYYITKFPGFVAPSIQKGGVYVYLQSLETGEDGVVRPVFKLRNMVEAEYPAEHGLMRAGQSVTGNFDLNGDGLGDFVVGTRDDNWDRDYYNCKKTNSIFGRRETIEVQTCDEPPSDYFGRAYVYYGKRPSSSEYEANEPPLSGIIGRGRRIPSELSQSFYRPDFSSPGTTINNVDYASWMEPLSGGSDSEKQIARLTRFGDFAAGLGDINGDGTTDLSVAAHCTMEKETLKERNPALVTDIQPIMNRCHGAVYLYLGNADPLKNYIDTYYDQRLFSPSPQDEGRFGFSVH